MGNLTDANAIEQQPFFVFDDSGRLQDVNDAACHDLAYERHELLQLSVEQIKERGCDVVQALRQMTHGEKRTSRVQLIRRDGTRIPAATVVQHFSVEGRRLYFTTARHIDGVFDRSEAIIETQRWSSLGRLSAGVVHDFNNLLMSIQGHAEFGLMKLRPNDAGYEEFDVIHRVGHRLQDLCTRILAYSRSTKSEITSLVKLCSETVGLIEVVLPDNINIESAYNPTESSILDYTEIQQVLVNAIVNAIDAIGATKGTISLATGIRFCNEQFIQTVKLAKDVVPGRYAFVEVKDTGTGIPVQILEQIFDQPVTTKEDGHGLGLAVAAEIVRKHRGFLDIVSSLGEGTSFRLFLPIRPGSKE